jgi:asparagine synthase (glutamine-hydrolysing)
MSAQAGVCNFDGSPVDQAFLRKLNSSIERHGPDGGDVYAEGSIGVVYRAFHTTQESRLERQPQRSVLGNVITWDGRLDNRNELMHLVRDEIRGDHTDGAIVMAAYEKWGTESFSRLVGDFGLSIWNPHEQTLILARDYVGIRHLYYYPRHGSILWCSDLAPLLLLFGDAFTLDDEYIAGHLAMYPGPHLTPYREVHSVPPGTFVEIRNAQATAHSYWRPKFGHQVRYKSDAEYEEHFRHVFNQAVRRRLRSDSPILAELSGGLDSSCIVCVADELTAKGEAETPAIHTISFFDSADPREDDRFFFTQIEKKRGKTGCHIDQAQYNQWLFRGLPEFIPVPGTFWDSRPLEAERFAAMQSHGCRASLSGIGGDELMGGVPDPRPELADLVVQLRLPELWKSLMAWSPVKKEPWIRLLLTSVAYLLPPLLRSRFEKQARVGPWVNSTFARRNRISIRQLGAHEKTGLHLPSKVCAVHTLLTLSSQMSQKQPALIGREEIRYPYLDQDLFEFVLAIPNEQLLRPGERRSLMRRALVNIVPTEILNRRSKWLAGRSYMVAVERNWGRLQEIFASPLSAHLGYLKEAFVRDALRAVRNGDITPMMKMLRVISLELWLQDIVARDLVHFGKLTRKEMTSSFILPAVLPAGSGLQKERR